MTKQLQIGASVDHGTFVEAVLGLGELVQPGDVKPGDLCVGVNVSGKSVAQGGAEVEAAFKQGTVQLFRVTGAPTHVNSGHDYTAVPARASFGFFPGSEGIQRQARAEPFKVPDGHSIKVIRDQDALEALIGARRRGYGEEPNEGDVAYAAAKADLLGTGRDEYVIVEVDEATGRDLEAFLDERGADYQIIESAKPKVDEEVYVIAEDSDEGHLEAYVRTGEAKLRLPEAPAEPDPEGVLEVNFMSGSEGKYYPEVRGPSPTPKAYAEKAEPKE